MHKTYIFNQENIDAHSHDRVLISQTFGREIGYIAACARLADPKHSMPLMILLPENQRENNELVYLIRQVLKTHKRVMIVISEGYVVSSRRLPEHWIARGHYDVNDDFIQYALPLIDDNFAKVRFY